MVLKYATAFSLAAALLFGGFLVPTPALANSQIPKVCEGRLYGECFKWLMLLRCARYGKWNPFVGHEVFCETATVEMMDLLEARQPQDENGVTEVQSVILGSRLSAILSERRTLNYLYDLPTALDAAMAEGTPFRLWEYTLAKAQGNETKALEWLAALFQDTSMKDEDPIVVEYTRVRGRPLSSREREVWSKAIQAVSVHRLQDPYEPAAVWLRPYPSIDTTNLNKGFYHFYVAAYVARKLRDSSPLGSRMLETGMAGFAPFLLNLIYETAELDVSLSPIHDPKPFSLAKRYKLQDIYAGYLGALFGLGGESLVAKAVPFETLSARMAADPRATTQALYENFLSPAVTPNVPVIKESPHANR